MQKNTRGPNSDLFRLIKTFSKAEKKHFRIWADRTQKKDGGKKNYLLLFSEIDKMTVYDEEVLKHKFRESPLGNHFSSEKRQLMTQLEHFLTIHLGDRQMNGRLRGLLLEAEILQRRKLFNRCRKKLKKLKEEASVVEALPILIEVNRVEVKLVKQFQIGKVWDELENLIFEKNELLKRLNEEQEFVNLYDRISVLMRTEYNTRASEVLVQIDKLANDPLLKSVDFPTFLAERMFYSCCSLLAHMRGDSKAEYGAYNKLVQLWESRPEIIKYEQLPYKLTLFNFLTCCATLARFAPFPSVLRKIRELKPSNLEEEAEDFQGIYFYELLLYMNTGQFDKAIGLIPAVEMGIRKHRNKITDARRLAFMTNLVFLYLIQGLPQKALKWNRIITDAKPSDQRKDLQLQAVLLEPLLLVETGDLDGAVYRIRSAREKLDRKDRRFEFESKVLTALSSLTRSADKKDTVVFESLVQELYQMYKNKEIAGIPGFSTYLLWAKSRAEHISMKEAALSFSEKN